LPGVFVSRIIAAFLGGLTARSMDAVQVSY
jgi:hypothetical protein